MSHAASSRLFLIPSFSGFSFFSMLKANRRITLNSFVGLEDFADCSGLTIAPPHTQVKLVKVGTLGADTEAFNF